MYNSGYKKGLRFSSLLSCFFAEHGKIMIIYGVIFLIGFFAGIINILRFNEVIIIDNIADATIVAVIKKSSGGFSVFFSRLFSGLFYLALLYISSMANFLLIFNALIFAYKSYLFGMCIAALCVLFNLSGIITALLVILPCGLAVFLGLIMFNAFFIKNNWNTRKFGRACYNAGDNAALTFAIFLFLVSLILESILLPMLKGVFIIV